MYIKLTPQRRDDTLTVIKNGDKLRINGELFSFVTLPDGATIPAGEVPCEWITGPVERINGEIHLTLILPHGSNPAQHMASPESLINPPDGTLELPKETANVDA
jgi:hypothetical protein